jgi:hypothetical protein
MLMVAGTLAVGLGVVGIVVPLLPTTPLLLLAAFCYARSSERFYRWLMGSPCLGGYIRSYRAGRGIPLLQKVLTIAALWITISATALLAVSALWLRLVLLAVAVGVTVHLLWLPTRSPGEEGGKAEGSPPAEEQEA